MITPKNTETVVTKTSINIKDEDVNRQIFAASINNVSDILESNNVPQKTGELLFLATTENPEHCISIDESTGELFINLKNASSFSIDENGYLLFTYK